ncbi:unnamed protein product [Microthlaspi erraticum]|uniref:Phorbol-ester/DAG-type domain-containing protein n=1 Tax=Microthlaspi erraticum TaxID=1685480 RepID=A0A6D2HGT6_9BRAS|nr:unnamed protein product [Microthlaspi erraticum]
MKPPHKLRGNHRSKPKKTKPPHKLPGDWQSFFPSKQTRPQKEVSENWLGRPYPHDQSNHKCPMSNPTQPHMLLRKPDYDRPLSLCFSCKGQHVWGKRYYYYCPSCNLQFHRGCHVLPSEMKHALHPPHPLTLISLDPNLHTSKIPYQWSETPSDSEDDVDDNDDDLSHEADHNHDDPSDEKCKCCLRRLEHVYYHCSICNFSFNVSCVINPLPCSITHLKSHKHTLTLFPRRVSSPCDACGLSLNHTRDFFYVCLPCNYMVHKPCIYLPRVIKITRHVHRLSLTPSLPPGHFSCGVCRLAVDVSHGQYSCNKGCGYAVHSKCATRDDVWDGLDLEDIPEEPDEDIEPFVRIDEETIQHFTHEHHLKLQGKEGSFLHGGKRFCEACRLQISISDVLYSCEFYCDFLLHEACACLPRVKHHPLHKHPLILMILSPDSPPYFTYKAFISTYRPPCHVMFKCDGCRRRSTGFAYACAKKDCDFRLDVTCASLPDSINHESHDHTLYINLTYGECVGCKSTLCSDHYLECMRCKSFLGLHCATLPSLAHYEHDTHPLTLCYGEQGTTSGQYWCELCELKLDASEWFYTCDSCRVTLHVTCLLGKDMYMNPRHIIEARPRDVEITLNDGNTRPFCYRCSRRCVEPVVYKWDHEWFCTLLCAGGIRRGIFQR